MAISSITCLKKHVLNLKDKDSLSHQDEVAIKGYLKRLEDLDSEFKSYHSTIMDLVEDDEDVLKQEQVKLDDHEDKITDLMSRLLDLGVSEEKVKEKKQRLLLLQTHLSHSRKD